MARDDRVEVELQRTVQRAGPGEEAAALHVVHVNIAAGRLSRRRCVGRRASREEEIAGVYDPLLRKVDDRVAVGMAAAKVTRSDLLAAQVQRELVRERDVRQADRRAGRVFVVRLLDVAEIDADILLRDDVRDLEQLGVAARVVVVLVCVEHVDDRLVGHRGYFRDDVVRVPIEHVVHENHACAGHVDGHVAAFARDHVKIAFHALDVHRLGRL